ncbi:MAG: hypothetical protein HOP17_09790 [Acidobacteria bacterium]|nr:hypothetical protein [Acidobacteriota bacterium]
MNERDKEFRLAKKVKLTIACLYVDNYKKNDDQGVIAKAREMLEAHNIELSVWPENGAKNAGVNTLTYLDMPELEEKDANGDGQKVTKLIPHEAAAYKMLRQAADRRIKGQCTFVVPLPIIFCQYVYSGYGITPPETKLESSLTRACLISQRPNDDKVTLLHEMGHAVSTIGDGHSPDKGNFMHEADTRSFMYRFQVERMGKALFSVG